MATYLIGGIAATNISEACDRLDSCIERAGDISLLKWLLDEDREYLEQCLANMAEASKAIREMSLAKATVGDATNG